MNRFTFNWEKALHRLIKSSQRNIPLPFYSIEKVIYLYKTKQKSTQQFKNVH